MAGLLHRSAALLRLLVLAAADLAALLAAWAVIKLIMVEATGRPFPIGGVTSLADWHLPGMVLVAAIFCVTAGNRGHYTQRMPWAHEAAGIVAAALFAALCDGLRLMDSSEHTSMFECGARWVLLVPFVVIARSIARAGLQSAGLWDIRTVVIGGAPATRQLERALEAQPSLGYRIVGRIPYEAVTGVSSSSFSVALASFKAEFLAVATGLDGLADSTVMAAVGRACMPFALIPAADGVPVVLNRPRDWTSPDATSRNTVPQSLSRLMKRGFDIGASGALLVILAPVMLAIAAAIKLGGGAVFTRAARLGLHGSAFDQLAYRAPSTGRLASTGALLAASGLGELPQLINVLRGEMSFVGPRPLASAETGLYGEDIAYYFAVRPGLTGLSQVTRGVHRGRRTELDVWYVRNWTFWRDIAIVLKTVPAMMAPQGSSWP